MACGRTWSRDRRCSKRLNALDNIVLGLLDGGMARTETSAFALIRHVPVSRARRDGRVRSLLCSRDRVLQCRTTRTQDRTFSRTPRAPRTKRRWLQFLWTCAVSKNLCSELCETQSLPLPISRSITPTEKKEWLRNNGGTVGVQGELRSVADPAGN